jgi:hypothetical protein
VNVKAVFLYFVLAALVLFDLYFYAFHWVPTRRTLGDLMEENARLVGAVDSSGSSSETDAKDVLDTAAEPSLPEDVEKLLAQGDQEPMMRDRYEYEATNLFEGAGASLTTAGKTILSNIALELTHRSYSRVIARVYPDEDYARSKPFTAAKKRSMEVIEYLSEKGVPGRKLLAVPINVRYEGGRVVLIVEE